MEELSSAETYALGFLRKAELDYSAARCLYLNDYGFQPLRLPAEAVEKYVKTVVLLQDQCDLDYLRKISHNLEKLVNRCEGYGLLFSDLEKMHMARMEAEYRSRYPGPKSEMIGSLSSDLEHLDDLVLKIWDWLEKHHNTCFGKCYLTKSRVMAYLREDYLDWHELNQVDPIWLGKKNGAIAKRKHRYLKDYPLHS